MRKAPRIVDLGPRYDREEGRSSVVAADERQGEHAPARLSLRAGWRLLRTPASENGIYEYYRVLLARPPEPEGLVERMRSLHVGTSMRFEVLAAIANSEEARRRGVRGPGLRLINLVLMIARRSGLARRVKRRRFHRVLAEMVQQNAFGGGPPAAAQLDTADLEARLERLLEQRLPAAVMTADQSELEDRVAALEDAMLELLNERARLLRSQPAEGPRFQA